VSGVVFDAEIIERRSGFVALKISGPNVLRVFSNEAGGHRWQRIPPTEKRGRVQTSTITVAVMGEPSKQELQLREQDLEWSTCRGSGAGGQHRNMTESAVQLRHVPTGLMVRCESERSQAQNKQTAMSILRTRLWDAQQNAARSKQDDLRRNQIGSGMRGDKRRTIRYDGVVDHQTGKRWDYKRYIRGDWN